MKKVLLKKEKLSKSFITAFIKKEKLKPDKISTSRKIYLN